MVVIDRLTLGSWLIQRDIAIASAFDSSAARLGSGKL
jgi:hypothetical protein